MIRKVEWGLRDAQSILKFILLKREEKKKTQTPALLQISFPQENLDVANSLDKEKPHK